MSPRAVMLTAAAGSAALLLGAYAFQVAGYAPCQLCLWQRWPHWAAVVAGFVALPLPLAAVAFAGAAAAATTAVLGLYHAGVEAGFWPGPASCAGAGGGIEGLTGAELLSTEGASGIVMCDEVAWSLGLSMAGWNALLSAALAALWLWSAWKLRRATRAPS